MKFFSVINNLFANIPSLIVGERLSFVETSFTVTKGMIPTVEEWQDILNLAPKRDELTIKLRNDSEDILYLRNYENSLIDLSQITEDLSEDDNIYIRIEIQKKVKDCRFSIYNYDSFVSDLLSKPLAEILRWFAKKLDGSEGLLFEVFDDDVTFSTRTLAFKSCKDATFKPMISRRQRLSDCKNTSHFYTMSSLELIPDDFIAQGIVSANVRLQQLFGRIATILSLAYVASSSSIVNDRMQIQISGQRTVNHDFDINDIAEDETWQNIYTWIYTDGNPADKAVIAHNVISLHCKYEAILNLDDVVLDAIRTNYKLYLRNNVDKYLNLKREISQFIRDVVSQAGDYSLEILGKFKSNLLALFVFLFTVVLTRLGDDQKWENIFTKDAVYIIELFLIGSAFYLTFCYVETKYKLEKIKEGYFAIKTNYKDVLSEAELNEVFEHDELFNKTERTVLSGLRRWSVVWGFILLFSMVFIEFCTPARGLIYYLISRISK